MTEERPYRYPAFEILRLVKAPKKCTRPPPLEKYREIGRQYDFTVYLVEEKHFELIRIKVSAGRLVDPTTYEAAFILDGERVRGIGYNEVARKRYYGQKVIPKGWHQNIIDPNLDAGDANLNRHDGMSGWTVSDFDDFLNKVCKLWNIDLGKERDLL